MWILHCVLNGGINMLLQYASKSGSLKLVSCLDLFLWFPVLFPYFPYSVVHLCHPAGNHIVLVCDVLTVRAVKIILGRLY